MLEAAAIGLRMTPTRIFFGPTSVARLRVKDSFSVLGTACPKMQPNSCINDVTILRLFHRT